MDYLAWNDRLAEYFFRPEQEGRRVFLYVTPDVLWEIRGDGASAVEEFVATLKSDSAQVGRLGLCQRALQAFEGWRDRGSKYPPYIGYLGLFVLAAGMEGEFASHAYYPRLRALLGEAPAAGQYPSFRRMLSLWDDLERWANEDKSGTLGTFRADISGSWMYVGLPIAQTILTEHERAELRWIFAEGGLDPAATPADEQLAQILLAYGKHRLRPRTLALLDSEGDQDTSRRDLRDLLFQTISEELEEWDGNFAEGEGREKLFSGAMRLCIQLDRVAAHSQITLRCKSLHEIPAGGLNLRFSSSNTRTICREEGFGWSTVLTDGDPSNTIKVDGNDLVRGIVANTEDGIWKFELPGSKLRIFEPGSHHGLPGLVECPRLPRLGTFYLLCTGNGVNVITEWGRMDCSTFQEINITKGLPIGWRLFEGSGPTSDDRVRKSFPALTLSQRLRLRCSGGLKHTRSRYFTFAPPIIWLDGSSEEITIWANENLIKSETQRPQRFKVPTEMERSGKILIEARKGSEVVARRTIYLSNESLPGKIEQPWCDKFGSHMSEAQSDSAVICGGLIRGNIPSFAFSNFIVPQLPSGDRVIFLGSKPGQFSSVHYDELVSFSFDWEPVWAIRMARRGTAVFCGISIDEAQPLDEKFGDHRQVQDWKQVLWAWRHRICPPQHQRLAQLWLRYQQKAKTL